MKQLLPQKYHNYIYIFALIILVIGMPVSKFLMSLSQIILACNWFLEGNLKNKFSAFFKNKPAILLSSILLLHFISLFFTSDFSYASNDIRIKLPLFALPIIIATSAPLSKKVVDAILQFFIAAVAFGTVVSALVLFGVIERTIVDIRDISIFISHIRFALLICFSVFVCIYFIKKNVEVKWKLLYGFAASWFIVFLFLMQSLTGLGILLFTSIVLFVIQLFYSRKKVLQSIAAIIVIALVVGATVITNKVVCRKTNETKPDKSMALIYTPRGNAYYHDLNSAFKENGNYIWLNVCDVELEIAWNKRSKIKFIENDAKGNPLQSTLIRFLTSKNLTKDFDGMAALTDDEIKAIERGVSNVNHQNMSSIESRIQQTFWEIDLYKSTGDVNGHSLTQRFEYWKASWSVIKRNILLGVGVGDLEKELFAEYDKMHSKLAMEYRLHPHNQFLSITLCFGAVGLLWFLASLLYPMIKLGKHQDFLYVAFFIITICSFFTEDTLETQAGVTFYAFLNSFLLFVFRSKEENANQ
jgi:O-antigen ligase